jgi:hypothetical protein
MLGETWLGRHLRQGDRHTHAPRLGNFFACFSPASESTIDGGGGDKSAAVDGALMMDSPAVRAPVRQRA